MSSIDTPITERPRFEECPSNGLPAENVILDSGYNVTEAAGAGTPVGKELPDSASVDTSSAPAEAASDRRVQESPTREPYAANPNNEPIEQTVPAAAAVVALHDSVEEPTLLNDDGVEGDNHPSTDSHEDPSGEDAPSAPQREAGDSGRDGGVPPTTFDNEPDNGDEGEEDGSTGSDESGETSDATADTTQEPERAPEPRPRDSIPTPYPEDFDERAAIAAEATSRLRELATPEVMKVNGVGQADQFERRLDYEDGDLRRALLIGERYTRTSGDYSELRYAMLPEEQAHSPEDRDHEAYLSGQIKERLDAIDPDDPQPVIALDIGAGRGVTWSRLALEYEDDIRASRLALVASNLASSPVSYHDPKRWPAGADQAEYQRLLEATEEDLVHFVNSTFVGLPDVTIPLPNGTRVGLRDSVAITHEVQSMTMWTHISEVTVLEATKVIAPGGMYLVGGSDVQFQRAFEENPGVYDQVNGIQRTHESLQRHSGLSLTRMPSEGAYGWHIFKDTRPRALR